MRKKLYILALFAMFCITGKAQVMNVKVTVLDANNRPVEGTIISIDNSQYDSSITNEAGIAELSAEKGDYITVELPNEYKKQVIVDSPVLKVKIDKNAKKLNFGYDLSTTKDKSTASISTVTAEDIDISGQINPGSTLFGLLPGLSVQQSWTMPSSEGPTYQLRGRSPLFIVDGFERPIDALSREEIESISVIKDAAALALYGMKGSNGVVLITTKRGGRKPMEIKINYQHAVTTPVRLPNLANAATYANAVNEALNNDGLPARYSSYDIADFQSGAHPYLYPDVDWWGEALRDHGSTNELNISFSGGTKRVQYYVLANYSNTNGLLDNTDLNEGYSTQALNNKLNFRTNLDVDVTSTTHLKLNLLGRLFQYTTNNGMDGVINTLYNLPSAAFPIKSPNGVWSENATWHNPIARIASTGYLQLQDRALYADLTLCQDLSMITPGLSAQFSIGYDNRASYNDTKSKSYAYEEVIPNRDTNGALLDSTINRYSNDTELAFSHSLKSQSMLTTIRAKVDYQKSWTAHDLNASLIYDQFNYVYTGRNSSRLGQSFIANVNYGYNNKYLFNLAASYAGYSTMPKGDKFRIFPAVSAAWILSNENFMKDIRFVDFLKLRASWGMTGAAEHGYELDRQFYNLNGGYGYYFGNNLVWNTGSSEGSLPVKGLKNETSYKTNVGLEFGLFNRLYFEADAFYDRRADILTSSSGSVSSALGISAPKTNTGINEYYGTEIALNWNDMIGENFRYYLRGNFSFVRTNIVEMNEEYKTEEYLKMTNRRIGQFSGMEAIGFFKDEADIKNSPKQTFSDVKPGDIKYKDQNGDGIINEYDKVCMGYSTNTPEIYYGFSLGFDYKGIGIRADFQGLANYTVITNVNSVYWPLGTNKTVSNYYLENRWTPENLNAKYPRLTTLANENNFQNNSIWMENGAYMKLRNLEVYYDIPASICKKAFLSKARIFVKGKDLFMTDHVKQMDPELVYSYYPTTKAYLIGLNLEF